MIVEKRPIDHEIVLPRLQGSAGYYQIVAWLREEGDTVRRGDSLLILETDKAAIELEAAVSGILSKIMIPSGQWVPVSATLGIITPDTLED